MQEESLQKRINQIFTCSLINIGPVCMHSFLPPQPPFPLATIEVSNNLINPRLPCYAYGESYLRPLQSSDLKEEKLSLEDQYH